LITDFELPDEGYSRNTSYVSTCIS